MIVFSVAFGIELHTTEYHWFSNSSISNGASALRFLLRLTYTTINLLEKRFKVQCTNGISVVIWSRLYLLLVCSYTKYCHFYINSKVSRNHCLRKESSYHICIVLDKKSEKWRIFSSVNGNNKRTYITTIIITKRVLGAINNYHSTGLFNILK